MTRQRRYEFDKKTRVAAFQRAKGCCEHCCNKILVGNGPHYHHRYKPATEPGSNTLDNCQVLCERPCHRLITDQETKPMQARTKRVFEKRINARPSSKPKWPKRPFKSWGAWRD